MHWKPYLPLGPRLRSVLDLGSTKGAVLVNPMISRVPSNPKLEPDTVSIRPC